MDPYLLVFKYIFFCSAFIIYSKEHLEKLKYPGAHDMLLAAICKAANLGSPFIILSTDWVYPPKSGDLSFSGSAEMVSTVHIYAY